MTQARDTSSQPTDQTLRRVREDFERQLADCRDQLSAAIRDRSAVEEQLRAANKRIELVLDSITDSCYRFSHDWRFTYLNSHAAAQMRALGKDPERLIGKVLWDEFADVPNGDAIRRVMAERVAVTDELFYPPLGVWVENHIYPSPDGGILMLQKDITERKKAEEKLQRCATYLADAERLSHIASWAVNVTTGETFWSDEHFRICGVDPESFEITPHSVRALIHPDDRDLASEVIGRAVGERQEFQWDLRFVRPDGSIRYAHSIGHPVFDQGGALIEYVGTLIDTTELKRVEEEGIQLVRRTMAAQEEERRRLAREMHDQLGERLSALTIHLALLRARSLDRPELVAHLDQLELVTKQLDTDVSFLVWELRPSALDDLGLVVALTTHAKIWGKHHGIEAQVRVTGLVKERLEAEIETTLYRITQEALTNVAKHAKARHVSILLERRRDHIFLMVEDDGRGFTDAGESVGEGAWGLVGMRERAQLVGGSLEFESGPGGGLTVVARIPAPVVAEGEDAGA